jgi:S-methyl-5-thioribose-1-phosphate isomerase
MQVIINGVSRSITSLWREGALVKMIDQRLLPHHVVVIELKTHTETAAAIRDMMVRGAGGIGVAAAYGVAQAALEARNRPLKEFTTYLDNAAEIIRMTRPTAVNLFYSIEKCLKSGSKGSVSRRVEAICSEADAIAVADISASERIGGYGASLIKNGSRILTHCNAGALAYMNLGTALSPLRIAFQQGKSFFVYVDETRPRSQGAKLTAWELQQENIPYALIVDSAAGYYMARGEVDLIIVGADRIAANGDTANKIGTYEKAVIARENGVPFYVAAPGITFDLRCRDGTGIEIEFRSPDEINYVWGQDDEGKVRRVRITAEDTVALNPSFDVTPAKYITGFITEKGLISPPYKKNIRAVFGRATLPDHIA